MRVVCGDAGIPDGITGMVVIGGGLGFERFFGLSRDWLLGCEFSLSDTTWKSSLLYKIRHELVGFSCPVVTYLDRLIPLDLAGETMWAMWCFCGNDEVGAGLCCWTCLSTISCIFVFLRDVGMRLMRMSKRLRSPCACNAYWARSLRARSVTDGSS